MKFFICFMFFASFVFSMDKNEPRGIILYEFAEQLSKTKQLFDTTSEGHPFKINMVRALSEMLTKHGFEEILQNEFRVSEFLEYYKMHLKYYKLQKYASFDGHEINLNKMNESQKKALMNMIVYQLLHSIK